MYYFVSDIHLGAGERSHAIEVEKRFVAWLEKVGEDAEAIFLCGDIFDFWFEYEHVVPKGFVRVLAQLARLTHSGVRVVFMAGNHDMWIGNYLSDECGVELYTTPKIFQLNDRKVHVAHGDNLNVTGDWKLSAINSIFRSSIARRLFKSLVHPDLALNFGLWWSGKSRNKHVSDPTQNSPENRGVKALVEYSQRHQESEPCDYYIFGHLHQKLHYKTRDTSGNSFEICFMNDWRDEPYYVKLDDDGVVSFHRA